MFSKFKVTSVSSAFTTHLPLIEVYEAEIRRLRGENEFLRHQNNSLVVQLNDALSQERKKASFHAQQKRFFELSKAVRDNKKRRIKNLVVQSLKGLQEFVPIEVCSFLPYFIFFATPLELLIDLFQLLIRLPPQIIIKPPFHHTCIPSGSRVSLYKNLFSLEYTYFDEFWTQTRTKIIENVWSRESIENRLFET